MEGGLSDVVRTELQRQPTSDGARELVMTEVVYPPGGVARPHRHPVAGIVYILEGIAESAFGGEPPSTYRAGEAHVDRADAVHTLFRNLDDARPLRFLAVYVVGEGEVYIADPDERLA